MLSENLFSELERQTKNTASIFEGSGMLNKFNELDYGFFPLGSGILTTNPATDENKQAFRIMVLGDDFGTNNYLEKDCTDNREKETNPTIKNLKQWLKINPDETFFTNFYLGVRKDGTNERHRLVKIDPKFRALCFEFFKTQMQIINPEIIICLGHDVRRALIDSSPLFADWKPKDVSFQKLFEEKKHQIDVDDEMLGKRKFIVIPHPSDTRNLNNRLKAMLKTI